MTIDRSCAFLVAIFLSCGGDGTGATTVVTAESSGDCRDIPPPPHQWVTQGCLELEVYSEIVSVPTQQLLAWTRQGASRWQGCPCITAVASAGPGPPGPGPTAGGRRQVVVTSDPERCGMHPAAIVLTRITGYCAGLADLELIFNGRDHVIDELGVVDAVHGAVSSALTGDCEL